MRNTLTVLTGRGNLTHCLEKPVIAFRVFLSGLWFIDKRLMQQTHSQQLLIALHATWDLDPTKSQLIVHNRQHLLYLWFSRQINISDTPENGDISIKRFAASRNTYWNKHSWCSTLIVSAIPVSAFFSNTVTSGNR